MIGVGDVVISIAGRDKGNIFLVVESKGDSVLIVNGRIRKIGIPKKKNVKHLKKVEGAKLNELALRIQIGEAVGNERVYRALKTEKQKIQED